MILAIPFVRSRGDMSAQFRTCLSVCPIAPIAACGDDGNGRGNTQRLSRAQQNRKPAPENDAGKAEPKAREKRKTDRHPGHRSGRHLISHVVNHAGGNTGHPSQLVDGCEQSGVCSVLDDGIGQRWSNSWQ